MLSPSNRLDNLSSNNFKQRDCLPSEKLTEREHEDLSVWSKCFSLIIKEDGSEEPNKPLISEDAVRIKRADLYTNTTNNRKYTYHLVFCNAYFSYQWPIFLLFVIIVLGPAAATTQPEEASISFSSPALKYAQPIAAPVISFVGYASSPASTASSQSQPSLFGEEINYSSDNDAAEIDVREGSRGKYTTTTTTTTTTKQDGEPTDDDQEEKKKKKEKFANEHSMTMMMKATSRSLEKNANNVLVETTTSLMMTNRMTINNLPEEASGKTPVSSMSNVIMTKTNSYIPTSWAVSYASKQEWVGITTSSTGQYVYAVVSPGNIYMSSDYGSSWAVSYASSQDWDAITTSSSGQYVYVTVYYTGGGNIYMSSDYGSSWAVSYASSQEWDAITTSSTGQYVYAAVDRGDIYSCTVPLSEPTSQPSPAPTASPQLVSPFSREGWSLRTIADKLDLHLWVYIVFFAGMFLVLLAVDQLQLLGTLRLAIYSSSNAYISSASFLSGAVAADHKGDADIHGDDGPPSPVTGGDGTTGADSHVNVDSVGCPDDSNRPMDGISEAEISMDTKYSQKARSQMDRQRSRLQSVSATSTFYPYSGAFYAYVATELTFFGCKPLLYPKGYRYPCSQRLLFSKGQSEDWLAYIFNTVNLLRCLFSVVTPLVSHYQWCWVYVLSLSISFFMTVFSNSVLITLVSGSSSSAILLLFNLILMRAAVSLCDTAAKAVLRVLFSLQGDFVAPNSNNIVTRALVLLLIPAVLTFACAFLLVLAAMFTVSSQTGSLLLIFIVQVQLSSFLMDLLLAAIMFMPDFHMNVSMKGWVTIFTLGGYYHEMLLHHKNPTPFVHYRHNCLCGLLVLDLIVSKDYALKRGWPTSATNQDGGGGGGVIIDESACYDSLHNGRFAGLYMEMEGGVEVSVASLLQKHDESKQEQMRRADLEMQKISISSMVCETINPMVSHIRQDAESRGATSGTDAHMDEDSSFTEVSKKKEVESKKEQRRLPFIIDRKQHQQEEREKERKTLSKKLNMQFIRSMIFFEKEKEIELRDSDASLRSNNDASNL